ncbi:hypothetical protein [Micavibrio aeruginosavorus]|uniref:hypothetical protein n=1 Tax=Micavibrio aeruginosavorus TaxID=349221 RepID=UPI003F4ACE68
MHLLTPRQRQDILNSAAKAFLVRATLLKPERGVATHGLLKDQGRAALIVAQDRSSRTTRDTLRGLIVPLKDVYEGDVIARSNLPVISARAIGNHLLKEATPALCQDTAILTIAYLEQCDLIQQINDIWDTKTNLRKQVAFESIQDHFLSTFYHAIDPSKKRLPITQTGAESIIARRIADIVPPTYRPSSSGEQHILECLDPQNIDKIMDNALVEAVKSRNWVEIKTAVRPIFVTANTEIVGNQPYKQGGVLSDLFRAATEATPYTAVTAHPVYGRVLMTNQKEIVTEWEKVVALRAQAEEQKNKVLSLVNIHQP